jgi:hypothetical protein
MIITAIKIVFISIISIFYYPVNTFFRFFQAHYRSWRREDKISFIIATPLYYLLFLVSAILSIPFENTAMGMHPPLEKFK